MTNKDKNKVVIGVKMATLFAVLLSIICLAFGGDLTGGFEDGDGFDQQEEAYEEVPEEQMIQQQMQQQMPQQQAAKTRSEASLNKFKLLKNFITSIDTMHCDSLSCLRGKLLKKGRESKEKETIDLYSFLVAVVMDKIKEEDCLLIIKDSVEVEMLRGMVK